MSQPTQLEADDSQTLGRGSREVRWPDDINLNPELENHIDEVDIDLTAYLATFEGNMDALGDEDESEELEETQREETDLNRPTPAHMQHLRHRKQARQEIKIGSLNMRGRNITTGESQGCKMPHLSNLITSEGLAILALLDTHWDEEIVSVLQNKYEHLTFFHTDETSEKGGVAFIINPRVIAPTKEPIFTVLITGRSAMVEVDYEYQKVRVATIYVPNEKQAKIQTIRTIQEKLTGLESRNEFVLTGDFNMVEDAMDRSPAHDDHRDIMLAALDLRLELNLIDGWRMTHPHDRTFTWKGKRSDDTSMARIDRIYIPQTLLNLTNEWAITDVGETLSDHKLVSVKILQPEHPFIGKGEWRLNPKIFNHPHFKREARKCISDAKRQMDTYQNRATVHRRNTHALKRLRNKTNPQKIWNRYKLRIQIVAKETQEMRRKEINKEIHSLKNQARKLEKRLGDNNDPDYLKGVRNQLAETETQISQKIDENRRKAEAAMTAKWWREDERGSKLWYSMNKERPRRQVLHSLIDCLDRQKPEHRDTDKMMEIARTHHRNLQAKPEMTVNRQTAIDEILTKATDKLNDDERSTLDKKISYKEVRETIKKSKTGKTPGCDGIPNEFWKLEMEWYREEQRNAEGNNEGSGEARPDIVNLIKTVFQDIDEYGPMEESFAEARMSLLYKKKDKRRIENYRPITLLNTDYKLYTTILTNRLKEVANKIIHPDQAGFMPKRLIYSQTKLTELVIRISENEGIPGMIMALDQEKAYDRIDHDYLWKTMGRYGLPDGFIQRVKNLYLGAKTRIRLNGCITDPFDILRGVRQGDPLSCLLYNIAIEPLFENIRQSELDGIPIHKNSPNALLSAYADDTTIYLGRNDDPKVLKRILDLFCKASTAKFNESKTEIIPLGTTEQRRTLIQTRHFNGWEAERDVHIANDCEAIRILGSWQGNHIDTTHQWDKIIRRQNQIMAKWAKSYPTLAARIRVAKALIASRALYLMTVNGIPKDLLNEMDQNIRNFIWQGKRGNVAWELAMRPKNEGGINAPNVKIIYEATKILWIRRWLEPVEERPKWVWAANAIVEGSKRRSPHIAASVTTEWIEQTWHEIGNRNKVPKSIIEMLTAARRYNVKISVIQPTTDLKLSMPAFFHPGATNKRMNNTKRSKCLRISHGISTVQDLLYLIEGLDPDETECELGLPGCKLYARKLLDNLADIWSPLKGPATKDRRYHTPRKAKRMAERDIQEAPVELNPDPKDEGLTLNNVRIFGSRHGYKRRLHIDPTPAKPLKVTNQLTNEANNRLIEVYTDGSATQNGWESGQSGLATWYGDDDIRNQSRRLQGSTSSNQRAELAAILKAMIDNRNSNLRIYSDSLSSLTSITKRLTEWENLNWHGVKNRDILQTILHEIRTREGTIELKWVKAHEGVHGNNEADALADEGRERGEIFEFERFDHTNSRALHDGARLNALTMKTTCAMLVQHATETRGQIRHPERIDETKTHLEEIIGLTPSQETILTSIWKLNILGRAKDHIWSMNVGRIKCGSYWRNVPGYEDRALCAFCRERDGYEVLESENHLWLQCEYNGQSEVWNTARSLWTKSSKGQWPLLTLALLRGTGALTLTNNDQTPRNDQDSERLRICISMSLWTIWKIRNQKAIQNTRVVPSDASKLFKHMLKELISNEWRKLAYLPKRQRQKKAAKLEQLWGHPTLADLIRGKPPIFHF